jgi:hypothetical protein
MKSSKKMHCNEGTSHSKKRKETSVCIWSDGCKVFKGHTGYTKMGESITRFPIKRQYKNLKLKTLNLNPFSCKDSYE